VASNFKTKIFECWSGVLVVTYKFDKTINDLLIQSIDYEFPKKKHQLEKLRDACNESLKAIEG